ncbi:hypothetical protein NE237_015752 [Protea cynaroides]|uniref:Uncharacterized protein n=1 Tax=Protea cynaroides TaxID=273540 RepID=A0A9Q0KEW0_9MAGN|nr:hypothetical protein NE237_015752 [Protea cynaroides]
MRKDSVDSKWKCVLRRWKTCYNNFKDGSIRLIVGWDSAIVDVEVLWSTPPQLIHSKVFFKSSKKEVYCSIVYVFNSMEGKSPLWDDLERARVTSTGPWTILGDFNIMRFGNEKVGGLPPKSRSHCGEWNKSNFGNLYEVQRIPLNPRLAELEKEAKEELSKVLIKEEALLKQKYFYKVMRSMQQYNNNLQVKNENNEPTSNPDRIKRMAVLF